MLAPRSEIDRVGLKLPGRIQLGQLGVAILPYQQHRAFWRKSLMTDIGWHRANVTRLHYRAGARYSTVAVGDFPVDLVAQLHEPFDPIIAMDDRQREFLS